MKQKIVHYFCKKCYHHQNETVEVDNYSVIRTMLSCPVCSEKINYDPIKSYLLKNNNSKLHGGVPNDFYELGDYLQDYKIPQSVQNVWFDEDNLCALNQSLIKNGIMPLPVKDKLFAFEYRGFWIESEPFDQDGNGHPEDGITYTSYVWLTKEDRDNLKDYIPVLCEVFDSPEELRTKVAKKIDKYIRENKMKR